MPFLVINGLEVPIADQKAAKDNIRVGDNRDRMFSGELRGTTRAFKKEWTCTTTPLKQDEALNLEGLLLGRGHYWSWDDDLYSTGKGLPPVGTSVATLRPDEGKFGGAVAVEEGTTNIVTNPTEWAVGSNEHQTTKDTGERYLGCKISRTTRLSDTTTPSTVASLSIANEETYTASIYLKCLYNAGADFSGRIIFYDIDTSTTLVETNTYKVGVWERIKVTYKNETGSTLNNVRVYYYPARITGSVTLTAAPQVEKKAFDTSFVDGTRDYGKLQYPHGFFNQNTMTFAAWWWPYLATSDGDSRIFHADTGVSEAGKQIYLRRFTGGRVLRLQLPDAAGAGAQQYDFTPSVYAANTWHPLAVVVDIPNLKARIHLGSEYQEFDITETPAVLDLQRFFLGCVGTAGQLNGMLDETHILPYAITTDQYDALRTLTQPASSLPRLNVWGSMVNRTEDNPVICVGEIEGSNYRQFMRGGWNTAGEEIRFRLREV